jgi:hypothetical protein
MLLVLCGRKKHLCVSPGYRGMVLLPLERLDAGDAVMDVARRFGVDRGDPISAESGGGPVDKKTLAMVQALGVRLYSSHCHNGRIGFRKDRWVCSGAGG